MEELPSGTITMLFSDIEGSTALVNRLGDRYGEALSAQRALIRASISACHGHEMGTEGDSFFVVFGSAGDAVDCCLASQRALMDYDWPDGDAVRVRMGLHSGEALRHEDGYIGLEVHRAARIAATAHGGQVVISDPTRALVSSRLPPEVSLRDLGFHRLKDIEAPEQIYQLTGTGLPGDFPPLKSLGTQTSLPVPVTPLVGRESDLEQLCAAITQPEVRLITLTGTGGVGKTRLALAAAASVAEAFPHGVFFSALATVHDAEVMWGTLAESLSVSGEGSVDIAVTAYLADRRTLLVLDNLEQLNGAAGVVAALLDSGSGVTVLAASRRPLHLPGEHEQAVQALELPRGADAAAVAECSAARLFAQHAGMVRPGFTLTESNAADVAAICSRLDGLPLAIELAASRVKLLAPKALLARLDQSLRLAAGDSGRPLRQQTMQNLVAWSYDLLEPHVAEVFRRMSVFAGGCDLDALEAVAITGPGQAARSDPLQVATDLMDVSLITVTEGVDSEPRVGMLETIRQYALERLEEAGELSDTRHLHAQHYASVAELAHEQLRDSGPLHLTALDRLEAEHDNLNAALAWSLDTPAAAEAGHDGRAAVGLRLVLALALFWYRHGYLAEGRRWLERAIEMNADDGGAPLAQLAHWLGVLLQAQAEPFAALPSLERSLAIWRELGDRDQQARELNSLGITHHHLGDLNAARHLLEESAAISREMGSHARLAAALTNLGQVESDAGNFDRATQVLQEALTLDRKQGDMLGVALDQQSLAGVSLRAGRAREALDLLSGMFDYAVSCGDAQLQATTLELFAAITAELGGGLRAARLAGAAEAIRQKVGIPNQQPELLERFLAPARATIEPGEWQDELAAGRTATQLEAVALLVTPGSAQNEHA